MTSAWLLVPLALLVTACGASDQASSAGPTVAPRQFEGTFELTAWVEDGRDVAVTDPTGLVLDAEFGVLSLETSCGVGLGSFSILDDGRAGVTIAGGRSFDCPPAAARQQERLEDALAQVDTWTAADGSITLLGSATALTFDRS